MKKRILFEIFIIFILSLTPLLWIRDGYVILGHDSGFRVNIQHHMKMLWQTFNTSVNTGVDWSLFKGFLMIQFPEFVIQTLFGSLERAQGFVLIFWFFLMAISMYIAMSYFFPKRTYWFLRLYTSIFWVFNFFILQAWFIAERAKFSLYAALPLSIVVCIAVFQKKISFLKGSLLFGLLYFFLNGGGSPPLFGASLIVWGVSWIYLSFLKKNFFFSLKVFIGFFCVFFLLNAYWIFPQIDLFRSNYSSAVASEGGIEGLLAWEREISKHASFVNLLRLQGIPDWYDNPNHPYASLFLTNPVFIVISFFPFFTIIFGMIFLRKHIPQKEKYFFWLVWILLGVGLFFASGSHPPTGEIYALFMKKIPGFAVFRSSFYKFFPVVLFSVVVLSGYFLHHFFFLYKKIRFLKVVILVGVLLYHFPFFSPNSFHFSKDFTTRVKIPLYVHESAQVLNKDSTVGRIMMLPELDRGFIYRPIDTYEWGYYSLDLLPRIVINKPIIANDSPHEIVQSLYDAIYKKNKEKFFTIAHVLGITHVLYRNDIRYSPHGRKISKEDIDRLFGSAYKDFGEWFIYKTDISSSISSEVKNDILSFVSGPHLSDFVSSSSAVISLDWQFSINNYISTLIFEAECFYCSEFDYYSFISSIHLPKSRYRTITDESIDGRIAASLFILREYMNAKSSQWIQEYQSVIYDIDKQLSRLSGRELDYYRIRIFAFLTKQKELGDEKVQEILDPMIDSIKKDLWLTDDQFYRYGIVLPESGEYRVMSSDNFFSQIMSLEKGYHRFALSKDDYKEHPHLFFVLERKRSEDSPSIFIFPYSYDSRWHFPIGRHVMVNGYENGWLLSPEETHNLNTTMNPVYTPHRIFLVGVFVTSVSLLTIISGKVIKFLLNHNT